ncbi:MAG: hypothetical protein ONB05_03275 [candidate division KSB1 bacterium]|nr:hypothetical protein [candidate division KSB1 bacterium]
MKLAKPNLKATLLALITSTILYTTATQSALAQAGQVVRWLRVGMLHSWYSNFGSETETGRPGPQQDGLRWPAQFRDQDCEAAKSMWIGTTDYNDRNGITYPYKVLVVGPRASDPAYSLMPVTFKMYAKRAHPLVYVDGELATDNTLNDIIDSTDATLKPDRMIVNILHSYIGITVTRKIMAFAQQNHENYFIYDYVFKNTGIVDLHGTKDPKTLTGVVFHFQYRYASGCEAFRNAWYPSNNISWGRNTVNDVVWADPTDPSYKMRAQYSWYGPHSASPVDDWGCPNPRDGRLAAVQYMGVVVLHADRSPSDNSNDPSQPTTTMYIGSDERVNYGSDHFEPVIMSQRYAFMTAGHPAKTHAEEVGSGFADQWGTDPGGYSQGQGFGPYTLQPGDSIHIVIAEAVAGISRLKSIEVGKNWYAWHSQTGQPTLVLPNGSTTTNKDEYKRLWVQTGKDSLFRTFRNAIKNYESGYAIPEPPPPPDVFEVTSGGDRIRLTWTDNADSWPNFDGYEIYRAIGRPDTLYEKIFSCSRADVVHSFDDVTARRGFDYYYYIQTKDDGSTNDSHPGVPLVSSKFYTMTNKPAYLRRPGGKSLSGIRVVPNPFNIRARSLQFGDQAPDRLAFFGLPPECTIKIYTERGDLIKTIEHTDGTGDEFWHSVTSSGQIVVSGVYIAYFEIPRDYYDPNTGELLFRKGESTYQKFVIIR